MSHANTPKVETLVKENSVMIFMKGTADFPMCGFSARAIQVLKAAGAPKLESFNVLEDDDTWAALEEFTQWPTVPQVFINGQFVGGCDIVSDLYERGELQGMVSAGSKN